MKVIFIVCYSPPYELFEDKREGLVTWATPDGSWVGVAGNDWGDQLGKALTDYNPGLEFEIWQNDLRADQVYTARIRGNLLHSQFPARMKGCWSGLRWDRAIYSEEMLEEAADYNNSNTVVFIPATVLTPFTRDLQKAFSQAQIIHYNLVNTKLLLPAHAHTTNPVKHMHRHQLDKAKHQSLRSMKNLLTTNDNPAALQQLIDGYPDINVHTFRLGLDLDFWTRTKTRAEARAGLGISQDSFVLVTSQRLVPEYQIDKLIGALAGLRPLCSFACYVTGHGQPDYEMYLKSLIGKAGLNDMIRLTGYVTDEELRDYFTAADVFGTFASMFAGSRGAIKAMALGIPVMHVTVGSTYEFLKANQAGILIDAHDYNDWTIKLQSVMDGREIKTVPREKIISHYGWRKTAEEMQYAIDHASGEGK